MADQLLENPGFEADWGEDESHRALQIPADGGAPVFIERGNIFTPPGWLTWFRHGFPVEHDPANPNGWAQPEVRDAWVTGDPRRVHGGQKSILFFTFFRIHDGGFLQQVAVEPGTEVEATAWAHAWSNHRDPNQPGKFPHPDDPKWSEGDGVGYNHFFALEGQAPAGGAQNFTFWVGIDPTGGQNPYADTVKWGTGAHIYNAYRQLPAVRAVAQSDTVTVFLRSRSFWPFKHCDSYWDDAKLEVLVEPPQTTIVLEPGSPQEDEAVEAMVTSNQEYEDVDLVVTNPDGDEVPVIELTTSSSPEGGRWRWRFVPRAPGSYDVVFTAAGGDEQPAQAELTVTPASPEVWGLPREQYSRTYVLMPPGTGKSWVEAVLDSGAWDDHRWTIGGSADDAGIGALEDKRVLAVNPSAWGDDLEAFFQEHYPRTKYVPLHVTTPAQLRQRLEEMD